MSDIGAIDPGRWHTTQDLFRIGATSFVKVGVPAAAGVCADATLAISTAAHAIVEFNSRLMPLLIPNLHATRPSVTYVRWSAFAAKNRRNPLRINIGKLLWQKELTSTTQM